MKKNYLIILFCAISSMAIGQTLEIVKDYYPNAKGFGLTPTNITCNSSTLFFNGAVTQTGGFWGSTIQYEAFVSDGTADKIMDLDINVGAELYSTPSQNFVYNDEIYFSAYDGTTINTYKVSSPDGPATLVKSDWEPGYSLQVVTEMGSQRILFVGKNPADETDNNNYVLQWDGTSNDPTIAAGQVDGQPVFNVEDFTTLYHAALGTIVFGKGTNPNENIGTEFFVSYNSMMKGNITDFHDLAPGDANGDSYEDNSSPENFHVINGVVYFNCNSIANSKMYKFDMFGGDTAPVELTTVNNNFTIGTTLKVRGEFDGQLLFTGVEDPDNTLIEPMNVWLYDISNDTYKALNSSPNFQLVDFESYDILDGKLYFSANKRPIPFDSNTNKTTLFCYDGTTLTDLCTDETGVSTPCAFNGKIYFGAEIVGEVGGTVMNPTYPNSTYVELFVYDPNGTSTSVEKAFNSNNIMVSPNPSYGYLNVVGLEANATYEIYSVSGSLLEQGAVINGQIDYNVQSGVYLLKISEGNNTKVVKIMVK